MKVDDQEPLRPETVTHPVEGRGSKRRLGVEQEAKGRDHVRGFREQLGIDGDVPQDETGGGAVLTRRFDHRGAHIDPNHLGDPLCQEAKNAPRAAREVDGTLRVRTVAEQLVDEAALEHPLQPLGAGPLCPDHLDAVAAPGMQAEVAAVLRGWLARPGDRLLDLDGVVSDSLVATALPGRVRRELTAIAPWVALSGGYLERRSHALRRMVHRTERRLVRETGSCIVERVGDVELGLRVVRRLHAQRWGEASVFLGAFDRFAAVCRAAADRGELAIDVLRAGDETVAVVASFEFAGRISYHQGGRIPAQRWRTAGTLLLARVFDDAARRGLIEADLLRGDEAYKALFADGRRELWRLRCAVGPRALFALQIDIAVERGRRLAGRTRRGLRSIPTRRPISRLRS